MTGLFWHRGSGINILLRVEQRGGISARCSDGRGTERVVRIALIKEACLFSALWARLGVVNLQVKLVEGVQQWGGVGE